MKLNFAHWFIISALSLACTKAEQRTAMPNSDNQDNNGRLSGIYFGEVDIDAYCTARARLDCYRLQTCQPMQLKSRYGTNITCEALRIRMCEGAFIEDITKHLVEEGMISFAPKRMGLALETHSKRHCDTNKIPPSTYSAIAGKQSLGDSCSRNEFCQSGFCDGLDRERCGICAKPSRSEPKSCPEQCPLGQFCRCADNDGASTCACRIALRPHEDCSSDRTACDDGSRCIDGRTESGDRITVCVPFPSSGSACGLSIGFLDCVGEHYCDNATCVAPIVVQAGEACNTRDRLCPADHDCRGVCIPRASKEEECTSRSLTTIPDGGPPTCAQGICLNRCRGISSLGEFCRDATDCQVEYGCYTSRNGATTCTGLSTVLKEVDELFLCP